MARNTPLTLQRLEREVAGWQTRANEAFDHYQDAMRRNHLDRAIYYQMKSARYYREAHQLLFDLVTAMHPSCCEKGSDHHVCGQ